MKLRALVAVLCLLVCPAYGATISGRVSDERGVGIFNVDLDFVVVATGNNQSANNDKTNATGNYSTTVPNAIYDVFYIPPIGSRFAGHVQRNVNLNTNQTVNVTLKDAWFVSGQVTRGDNGQPAVGVDLDFTDLTTGAKIYTPRDGTDLTGRYNVAVPKGIYEVTWDGPVPELVTDPPQLASHALKEVSVTGARDFSLPAVTLPRGFHVTGSLLDDKGDAAPSVDIDFYRTSDGVKITTLHDNTDAGGDYDVVVPAGTYNVEFDPPATTLSSAPLTRTNIVVSADRTLGLDTLPLGWAVQGKVKDPEGTFLRGVRLELSHGATGVPQHTANDETDAAGNYLVRVISGTWDLRYNPRLYSLTDPDTRQDVLVTADRTLTDTVLPWHDQDGDLDNDRFDNCPFTSNANQLDTDLDGIGDACDNCVATANARQENNDPDAVGNACDNDDDNDGQLDTVDSDRDGDGVANSTDRCPDLRDIRQFDRDADGTGDACDPNDGEVENLRAFGKTGFGFRSETGASKYTVIRQQLEWLSPINYGVCLRDQLKVPMFLDSSNPDPGFGFSYLVTATIGVTPGSLGAGSSGVYRTNARSCP
jgi:hypothetical protein